jgi:hypothetical protein
VGSKQQALVPRRFAMHMKKVLEKIAYLEFVNDQLTTELQYVDKLLKSVGFANGLVTVKQAAQELYEDEQKATHEEEQ